MRYPTYTGFKLDTTIATTRRDTILDLFGHHYPNGPAPSVTDLSECLEMALALIGTPWVWYLATVESPNGFARLLSRTQMVPLFVSDSVHTYCRMH